ncbi:RNase p and RNase mrp subunit [Sarocladium implicatum]|nr:RNase p and RNase mrp subunit [Sarocladium implicatum]
MSTQAQQAKQQPAPRKKVVHQLDTPFSTVTWPEISPQDQDTILELLCSLIAPVGQHRQNHVKRSKGKRAKSKDKREVDTKDNSSPVPPEPPIMAHVDVGFNCITRNLQGLNSTSEDSGTETTPPRQYSAVFVARGDQSAAFNCHFPQMVGAATDSLPHVDKTRLVGFSRACSERLSMALGIPRVSSLAIVADVSEATALQELVRNTVPVIDVPWLQTAQTEIYRPTKINAIETTVGKKKARAS